MNNPETASVRRDRTRRPSAGDPAEKLFHEYCALADGLARRYSFGRQTDDDLRQVARLGLLLAARRFDPEKGPFDRFAAVTVIGELKKHLRSHGWGVRVPRARQEDAITVAAARERLAGRMGREPTMSDVADHTGFDVERVVEAVRVQGVRFSSSLDGLQHDVPDERPVETQAMVSSALGQLDHDNLELIRMRYGEGLTQTEIGRVIGVSQPQVHRRLERARSTLRALLTDRTCEATSPAADIA